MHCNLHAKFTKLHLTWIEAVAEHEDVAKVLDHEEGELVIEGGPVNEELIREIPAPAVHM